MDELKKEEIIKILKKIISKNRIKKAYLFGSFTKKKKNYNDIDVAIEAPDGFTLLDLSRVANYIEDKIGLSVDIVTLRSMHPKLKKTIQKELVAI